MTSRVTMLTLEDPYTSQHGGTMRTRSFHDSFSDAGMDVSILFPRTSLGMQSLAAAKTSTSSRKQQAIRYLGNMKRRALPMPTEWGARSAELSQRLVQTDPDLLVISVLAQARFSRMVDAPLWLDFMDVWSTFASVEAQHRSGLFAASARAQAAWLERRERHHGARATLCSAAGWRDASLLRDRGVEAHWIPVPLLDDEFVHLARDEATAESPTVGFLGNFEYWPNRDALGVLLREWSAPLIAAGWKILVAGRHSDHLEIDSSDVSVLGPVASVDEFYRQVDATVAPVRLGGGMKVKVLESLSRGRPVMGTSQALEGFPPAVRDLCVEIGADARALPSCSHLQQVDPRGRELTPFRQSQVSSRIQELLRGTEVG